jgi:hypothetical protein
MSIPVSFLPEDKSEDVYKTNLSSAFLLEYTTILRKQVAFQEEGTNCARAQREGSRARSHVKNDKGVL